MIYKGDVIRLFNPTEAGLKYKSHMHILTDKLDLGLKCERKFVVCTTSPTRYIKKGIPFIYTDEEPFREKTYIRLDPIYSVENVKIIADSRTNPHRLTNDTEEKIFRYIKNGNKLEINREEFINLNYRYAKPV